MSQEFQTYESLQTKAPAPGVTMWPHPNGGIFPVSSLTTWINPTSADVVIDVPISTDLIPIGKREERGELVTKYRRILPVRVTFKPGVEVSIPRECDAHFHETLCTDQSHRGVPTRNCADDTHDRKQIVGGHGPHLIRRDGPRAAVHPVIAAPASPHVVPEAYPAPPPATREARLAARLAGR